MKTNRRKFITMSGLGIAAATPVFSNINSVSAITTSGDHQLQFGIASYSLRKFTLDESLEMCKRLGVDKIALKSVHLPLDSSDEEIKYALQKCESAGIEVYGGGAIFLKNKDDVDNAFRYARKAGMKVIIGIPEHEMIPYIEEKVKEYDIKMAIHNHGPGDKRYPSVKSVYEKVERLDPRMGMCLDIGHAKRSATDPSDDLKKYFNRIFDVHVKDITEESATAEDCEVGRGVIDIPGFINTALRLKYKGVLSLEYEINENDPLPGMAESLGYLRGTIATIKREVV